MLKKILVPICLTLSVGANAGTIILRDSLSVRPNVSDFRDLTDVEPFSSKSTRRFDRDVEYRGISKFDGSLGTLNSVTISATDTARHDVSFAVNGGYFIDGYEPPLGGITGSYSQASQVSINGVIWDELTQFDTQPLVTLQSTMDFLGAIFVKSLLI